MCTRIHRAGTDDLRAGPGSVTMPPQVLDGRTMARFLSNDWAREVNDVLSDDESFVRASRGVDVTVQQVIVGVPGDGTSRYWTRVADGHIETGIGDVPDPDLVVEQDYDTAVALNRGELHLRSAFLQGRVRVEGNIGKLLEQYVVIDALGPIDRRVPTEY